MALGIWGGTAGRVEVRGQGGLSSVFAVSELASAAVGAAALAVADLIAARHGTAPRVEVDRRLASFWFGTSIRPIGWQLPSSDGIAGDYAAGDGWIRLHTHAPHHQAAALEVLGVPGERARVADAVRRWGAEALETAVVDRGGCAAAMRDLDAWDEHPQGRAVAAEPLLHWETGEAGPPPGWAVPRARPLTGVKVLDLTRVLAGPVATRFLAGFGAEVLRIDPPHWNEPAVVPDVVLGKRCARLDLHRAGDRGVFEALLAEADVLVHGYRPGALPGLGLDPARRAALRPGLVDVSLDAWGWSGPWQGRRGFDSLVQMSSGIADAGMRRLGRDRPTPLPVQALDHATGYLLAAAAVRGLTERLQTGRGSRARASLARTARLLVGLAAADTAPLAPETPQDCDPAEEATGWGPALRLRPPCQVAGAAMHWDVAAGPLGAASPRWVATAP